MDYEMNEDVQDALLGLGSIDDEIGRVSKRMGIKMTPEVRKAVRHIATRRSRIVAKGRFLTRNQAILASKVNELPEQAVVDLKNGVSHSIDGERYIAAKVVAGGGNFEFLRNPPNSAIGITNLNDGKMPSTANMLLSAVKLEIGNSTSGNPDAVEYLNRFDAGDLPSAFQNGEIEISANGKIILPSTPTAKFFANGGVAMVNSKAVEVELNAPKLIPANAKIEVSFRMPTNGVLFAADNSFMKVTLLGPETAPK